MSMLLKIESEKIGWAIRERSSNLVILQKNISSSATLSRFFDNENLNKSYLQRAELKSILMFLKSHLREILEELEIEKTAEELQKLNDDLKKNMQNYLHALEIAEEKQKKER